MADKYREPGDPLPQEAGYHWVDGQIVRYTPPSWPDPANWTYAICDGISRPFDGTRLGPRVQTPDEIAAAIAAARAEGEKAGRDAGREEMRQWCAQFVEDVEGNVGPVELANRMRTAVLP